MTTDIPTEQEEPVPADLASLAARAIKLAEDTAGVQAQIVSRQNRDRRTVRILAASVVLDIVLSIALTVVAVLQFENTRAIHQSQLAACAIGNDFRSTSAQVWDHVVALSTAPPGETPEQKAQRERRLVAFQTYLHRQFHPVNCLALYGIGG